MAPALTQAAEPPSLAEATHHSSPPPSALASPKGIECLNSYNKLLSVTGNSDSSYSYSKGIALPICGWAEGCPPVSVCHCTMEDVPHLNNRHCENTKVEAYCEELEKVDSSNIIKSTSSNSINNEMGCESATVLPSIMEIPNPIKQNKDPSPLSSIEWESVAKSEQNDLINIMEDKDFPVNDFIDTLTSLAANSELGLLNSSVRETTSSAPSKSNVASNCEEQVKSFSTKLAAKQCKLERKKKFLIRRLRRVTARGLGGAISAQLNHLSQQGQQCLEEEILKSKQKVPASPDLLSLDNLHTDSMKNMTTTDLVSLVRRVEASQNLKKSAAREKPIVIPALSQNLCFEADIVAAEMKAAAREHVHHDSDATESSSGGESCDEMEPYEHNLEYRSIRERALYRYYRKRANISAKWTWLQTQIEDIDLRVSSHLKHHQNLQNQKVPESSNSDLPDLLQINENSLPLTCGTRCSNKPQVNGYHLSNNLKSSTCDNDDNVSCSRTIPFTRIKRRQYFHPSSILPSASNLKAFTLYNKFSDITQKERIMCMCVPPKSCILCVKLTKFGHNDKFPNLHYMKLQSLVDQQRGCPQKLSLVDSRHHYTLTDLNETVQSEVYSHYLHSHKWQEDVLNSLKADTCKESFSQSGPSESEPNLKKRRKEFRKTIRSRDCSRDSGNDNDFEEELTQWQSTVSSLDSPCPSPVFDKHQRSKSKHDSEAKSSSRRLSHVRNRQNHSSSSFDINNIVIPYSMAAISTVESLDYKEILTPDWREVILEPLVGPSTDDVEDLSDEVFASRHSEPQQVERNKFFRNSELKGHLKMHRLVDSSGANTPLSEISRVASPGPIASSEDSNHSFSPATSMANVLTFSLSSLKNMQNSEDVQQDTENPDSVSTSKLPVNFLKSRHSSNVSQDVSSATEKSFCPINPAPCSSPNVQLTPFPCRVFPLNDHELGDMLVDNVGEVNENGGYTSDTEDRLTFSLQNLPQVSDNESELDVKSRASPSSESTDSAPDDDFQWDDSEPPNWTISALPNSTGGCVMQIQRH